MAEKIAIHDKVKRVLLARIRPNAWNPNEQSEFMFNKELASIRRFGFLDPISVRAIEGEPDFDYEIVDGEHRYRAMLELGQDKIPALDITGLSVEDAKALTVIQNETRGSANPFKLGVLMGSMLEGDPTLLDVLPYHQEEIDHILHQPLIDWNQLREDEQSKRDAADARAKEPPEFVDVLLSVPAEQGEELKKAVDDALARLKKSEGNDKSARSALAVAVVKALLPAS